MIRGRCDSCDGVCVGDLLLCRDSVRSCQMSCFEADPGCMLDMRKNVTSEVEYEDLSKEKEVPCNGSPCRDHVSAGYGTSVARMSSVM